MVSLSIAPRHGALPDYGFLAIELDDEHTMPQSMEQYMQRRIGLSILLPCMPGLPIQFLGSATCLSASHMLA